LESLNRFYMFLVETLSIMANAHYRKLKKQTEVDWTKVVMPASTDVFKVCRLMWQAIVGIRNGIPDGQHRIAAMMKVLENWSITVDPTKTPPRTFVEDKKSLTEKKWEQLDEEVDSILQTLQGRATTRVIFPTMLANMEQESMQYSLMREMSQSLHKPRMFKDM